MDGNGTYHYTENPSQMGYIYIDMNETELIIIMVENISNKLDTGFFGICVNSETQGPGCVLIP